MPLDEESLKILGDLEDDKRLISQGEDAERRQRAILLFKKNPTEEEKKRITIVKDWFSRGEKKSQPKKSTTLSVTLDELELSSARSICELLKEVFDSKEINWERVIINMCSLAVDGDSGGTYYQGFFEEVAILLKYIHPRHLDELKPGIVSLLSAKKLSGDSDKTASLGNYKGAAAELIDALRSAAIRGLSLRSIRLPTGMIKIDKDLTQATPQDNGSVLSEQDIDRIEVLEDETKVYIEVKADVETAVDKHGKNYPKLQLLQILNVIATAERKDTRKGHERARIPAVSIVNHAEWLRLFTGGTAYVYASLGFYLCIGGVVFSPQDLRAIHRAIASAMEGREKSFFHANIDKFPSPMVVRRSIRNLESLLVIETLPERQETSKLRFIESTTKKGSEEVSGFGIHLLEPKKDPIVIKSNRPTGNFGPIGPPTSSGSLLPKLVKKKEKGGSTGLESLVLSREMMVLNDGLPGMMTSFGSFEEGSIVRVPCLAQGRASCGQRAVYNALAMQNPTSLDELLLALGDDDALRSLGPLEEDIHEGQVRDMLDGNGGGNIVVIQDYAEIPILAGLRKHEFLKPSAPLIAFLRGETHSLHLVINTRAPNAYGGGGGGHWISVRLVRPRRSNEVCVMYADSLQTENHDRSGLIFSLLRVLGLRLAPLDL